VAAILIAAFYGLLLASAADKSLTADETRHATAGYTYWRFNDYRLNPGNGTLAQRIMALPLLEGPFQFPAADGDDWRRSDELAMGDAWFNQLGNNVEAMLARGRAVCALFAAALAALVWWWARRIFGPQGAMLSLLLCILNPTVLANGPLMTSDTACALFFLASTLGWWAMLQRLTPGRVLASALVMGGLFITKMSAVLILPVALILAAGRIIEGGTLPAGWGAATRELRRSGMALGLAAAAAAHLLIAIVVIWASFGFRYSAFNAGRPGVDRLSDTWEDLSGKPAPSKVLAGLRLSSEQSERTIGLISAQSAQGDRWTRPMLELLPALKRDVLTPGQAHQLDAIMSAPPEAPVLRALAFIDRHRLLPEAYTYGCAYIRHVTLEREAFFNGHYSLLGWRSFFPYTALVKTPLPVFGILLLAAAAVVAHWLAVRRREGTRLTRSALRSLYAGLPFWTLFGVYWAAAISSHLNIGHRHLLPTYPPLFILGGAAAVWWSGPARGFSAAAKRGWLSVAAGVALAALVAAAGAETLCRFPNYLAYFNLMAGGPDHAYRHLVDSSLDWGQDLPGVRRYIAAHPSEGPFYLSYFGTGSPASYGIAARSLNPMPAPIQFVSVPAGRVGNGVGDVLRDHPGFEVAAVASEGEQSSIMLLERPEALRLQAGTYFISATMLQWGPWDPHYEARYQSLHRESRPFLDGDWSGRMAALRERNPGYWLKHLSDFNLYCTSRLCAYLRIREADGTINGSILVYHVGAEDLRLALDGPAPEAVADPRLSEEAAQPTDSLGQPIH
jgi:4-amino-4-deoxy-L-arabinose transferase-like glycosyltransferase